MSETYKPVPVEYIKGFTLPDIQGVTISTKQTPFKNGHLPQFAVVSVETTENGRVDSQPNLRKISNIHRRSYEYVLGKENAVVWADEFGNIFTALNTKGNNCTTPEVCKSDVSPSGFFVYGLQDSDSMVRVLRVSEILRSKHVDTEVTVKVIEPAELPYNDQFLPLTEFKKRLVQAVWVINANDGQGSMVTGFTLPTRQDIPQISKFLDKTTFLITARGVQVNERLADLEKATSSPDVLAMLNNAFRFVNTEERLMSQRNTNYKPDFFSVDKPEDVVRYFNEYLPKRIAKNFSGMHKLGLVHRFPHTGNISTVGSLYDLDSVRGELFGDRPTTPRDMVNEILQFFNGNNNFSKPEQIIEKIVGTQSIRFRQNFLKHYIKEMGWEGDITRFGYIFIFLEEFSQENQEMLDYYLDEISLHSDLHWDITQIATLINDGVHGLDKIEKDFGTLVTAELVTKASVDIISLKVIKHYVDKYTKKMSPGADYEDIHSIMLYSSLLAKRQILNLLDAIEDNPEEDKEIETIAEEFTENDLNPIMQYRYPLYQKLITDFGWEGDVVRYADVIDAFFEQFENAKMSPSYLGYYLEKLLRQLGWNFVLSESLEDVIKLFHRTEQKAARKCVEQALRDAPADADREQVIENALKSNSTGEDFLTFPAYERYITFICAYINDKLKQLHAQDIERVEEKYGKRRAEIVANWFLKRYENKFVNNPPPEVGEKIDLVGKARIEKLKKKFQDKH